MNKMKEVANLLGVELGERFNIEDDLDNPYFITEEGLFDCDSYPDGENLIKLLNGNAKIIKLPFRHRYGQTYWTISCNLDEGRIYTYDDQWIGCSEDYARYKSGLVFRTEKKLKKLVFQD